MSSQSENKSLFSLVITLRICSACFRLMIEINGLPSNRKLERHASPTICGRARR